MKMMTDRKMANPCIPRRLFQTVLFSWYAIQEPGTKIKKRISITRSMMTNAKICGYGDVYDHDGCFIFLAS